MLPKIKCLKHWLRGILENLCSAICSKNPGKISMKKFRLMAWNVAINELLHRYFSRILTADSTWKLSQQLFLRTPFTPRTPQLAVSVKSRHWELFWKKRCFETCFCLISWGVQDVLLKEQPYRQNYEFVSCTRTLGFLGKRTCSCLF